MIKTITVEFYIRFYTFPGQSLWVTGNIDALGQCDPARAIPLQYMSRDFWKGSLVLEANWSHPLQYHYVLRGADGMMTEEWGDDRIVAPPAGDMDEIQLIDTWNFAGEFENVFFTAPFKDVLLTENGHHKKSRRKYAGATHVFRVKAPLLGANEVVCLLGNGPALGEWDTDSPVLMEKEGNWWTCGLQIPPESFPLEYKYGIYHKKSRQFLRHEDGTNRSLPGDARPQKLSIVHDGFIHMPNHSWRGAGVTVPVFSLRSKKSFGVGEFTDLKLLIDWAVETGLKLIQLLPIQDTTATHTWRDSYPYAAISAFALHPIHLNLEKCAGNKYADLVKTLRKKQRQLNDLPELDYEQTIKIKLLTIKELFELQQEEFKDDPGFQSFYEKNEDWLVPYAAFCYLRDKNGTSDFTSWKVHGKYDAEAIRKYVSPGSRHYGSILLHYFIQYHLHQQLNEAYDYAHENGVVIKGDIPIGIYRFSCDAWMAPRLYHMDMQAGAPPDNFAIKGQNWGFPTYNWEEMEKDGYAWWKQRFEKMSHFCDAFRIDHILGFFRIWSIPMDVVEGILGHFSPAIPVYRREFEERGIPFDLARYTRPFINDAVLWEIFGNDADQVKDNYLEAAGAGLYSLKPAYDTQRKLEAFFAGRESKECGGKLMTGLFDLISNVILLPAEAPEGPEGQQFHFRIDMESTTSFRFLDWEIQQRLKDLYVNYFYQRQDWFWQKEAMHRLPALKRATNMLVCGEDLGMVPHCVPDVMRQLGILSLEIQRMPKDPNREFFNPASSPYLAVVTPSTHDMSTIRGWWEEDREKTQRFFNQELGQWGEAPPFCEPWINKAIVLQHLHSPALWSIFQIQDLMGMSPDFRRENPHDERINVPANPQHYWRYRMHLNLEDLLKEKGFNEELRNYVINSGR